MPQKKCSLLDVILDGRMIRHSGIGTYIQGLLSGYRAHPFFSSHSLGIAVPPSLSEEVRWRPSVVFDSTIYSLQEQVEYSRQLPRCRLWHAPHYNAPFFKGKTKIVVTVHDLIHWIFRKDFFSPAQAIYARWMFARTVRSADRLIAVSEQTRKDLIEHFKADPKKIIVIPEGVSPDFFAAPDLDSQRKVLEKYSLPKVFFLYVGLIKPHKNVKRLIEIFRRLRVAKKLSSSLVLVGRKDKRYPSGFESLGTLRTGEGIHYIPYVDSAKELHCLYAACRALAHVSLYEGFGLTCLEAMASGAPVIVSKVASLPEVVGGSGYYVNPLSEDSISDALVAMEENESLRDQLAQKGRLRAQQFDWAKAAEATIQVYDEVLTSTN